MKKNSKALEYYIKSMLWLWQLPQMLIAYIILAYNKVFLKNRFVASGYYVVNNYLTDIKFYGYKSRKPNIYSGISLGKIHFIWIDIEHKDTVKVHNMIDEIHKHELMHTYQSMYLGPLYLIIALISVLSTSVWSHNRMEKFFTENFCKKYVDNAVIYCKYDNTNKK